jgi:hypothetical protein
MIALRARHEALEVARDVAYPPLEVPPPPAPALPDLTELDYEPLPHAGPAYVHYEPVPQPPPSTLERVLMSDVVLSLLMILLGVAVVLLCKYG